MKETQNITAKKANNTAKQKDELELTRLTKQYVEGTNLCKVTFMLPKEATENAHKVTLTGDFNDWDTEATPLKKDKNGIFSVTVELEAETEHQYKFLIDDEHWENDWNADRYEKSCLGNFENSVVELYRD
ncbi:MAG: isoamylase early set domain-containing protein [Nitrospirae bacterium]|nr:isoamylase early set domain-containing protein [Nitrospirota bacterium]MBF0535643.1 isoamylase early set domain-containing protein [Nitrospirota bacterium]MBF0616949.1 isoamylase early set domain-containing protein [Nitrospirota bacterium]